MSTIRDFLIRAKAAGESSIYLSMMKDADAEP